MLVVALGLAASAAWGLGDFLGGSKSRVLPALTVLLVAETFGLLGLGIVIAVLARGPHDAGVLWACPAALAGTAGLFAFYRGMAAGAMSIVAPIAGASAVVPVIVGLSTGDRPGSLAEVGFAAALGGVVLASLEPHESSRRIAAGAGWALLSIVGFGGYFVPMHAASVHDPLWAAFVFRATSVPLVCVAALVARPSLRGARPHLLGLAAAGLLDTGGNALFGAASAHGFVSTVSVLASLYPIVTVALARVFLGERVARTQEIGVLLTLVGVALVSTG